MIVVTAAASVKRKTMERGFSCLPLSPGIAHFHGFWDVVGIGRAFVKLTPTL